MLQMQKTHQIEIDTNFNGRGAFGQRLNDTMEAATQTLAEVN